MISSISSQLYTSLPSEQRLRAVAQLEQKSPQTDKNIPVYLQVERAKTIPSPMPYSIVA